MAFYDVPLCLYVATDFIKKGDVKTKLEHFNVETKELNSFCWECYFIISTYVLHYMEILSTSLTEKPGKPFWISSVSSCPTPKSCFKVRLFSTNIASEKQRLEDEFPH